MTIGNPSNTDVPLALSGLHSISDDLGRLDNLIGDAIARLMETFDTIQALAMEFETPEISRAAFEAVTALQFQDMATQLIAHCRRQLAHAGQPGDDPISFSSTHFVPPCATGPVSQCSVSAGSVDLF